MAERDPHALAREALALSENATPGPWRDGGEDRFADDEEVMRIIETAPKESELSQLVAMVPTGKLVFDSSSEQCVANVAFIARARTLLPALARAVLDTERRTMQDTASEDLERRYRANLLWLEQHRHSLMVTADGRWWVPDWAPADNPYDAIENARLDVSMETPHA